MNQAIESARQAYGAGDTPSPSALHRLAKQDAEAILGWIGDNLSTLHQQPVVTLYGHLTVDELAACIYRHAMYEAGAIVDARTKKAYDICPYCAHRMTV